MICQSPVENRVTEKLSELSCGQSSLTFSDVAGNGYYSTSKLARQAVQLSFWKSACSLVSLLREAHSLLPGNQVLIRETHDARFPQQLTTGYWQLLLDYSPLR
jgi:hypothetical protein